MMESSCVLFRAANLITMDYPMDAALASGLAVCDKAVIVVGQSQDETRDWIADLAFEHKGRVKVVFSKFYYDRGWQERWWNLASSHTEAEWLLWLDADEVIDPDAAPDIRAHMEDPGIHFVRFPFTHLYGTPNWEFQFPLTHNTRLGRRSAGYRMVNRPPGAACHVVADGHLSAHHIQGPTIWDSPHPILHYGWARNAQALGYSQTKQLAWYRDGDGLQEGKIPDVPPYPFDLPKALEEGRLARFYGTHPRCIERWLEAHREAWEALEPNEEPLPKVEESLT